MYIQPNSTIELFGLIPLDNTYENTLFFETVEAQNTFFTNWNNKKNFSTAFYRVEPTKNSVKIQIKYEDSYRFSYMRFKNTSYENKWFYAFITKVEYVDNITTRFHYDVDVMQTWLPNEDYVLGQCFVEREHTETDNIGDNLVTESFSCNEYVINETHTNFLDDGESKKYIVVAIANATADTIGMEYDGAYSGCMLFAFEGNTQGDFDKVKDFLLSYSETPEKILNVYIVPKRALDIELDGENTTEWNRVILSGTKGASIVWRAGNGLNQGEDTLDGYKPKNNKCYTYPFNYGNVCTSNGDSLCVKYEYFKNEGSLIAPTFVIDTTITSPVQSCLRPRYYKNTQDDTLLTNKLILSSYPVCAWSTDAYQAYVQTQKDKDRYDAGVSAIGGIASIVAGSILLASGVGSPQGAGMVAGGVTMMTSGTNNIFSGVRNAVQKNMLASTHDTQSSGVGNSANVDFAKGKYGFTFYRFSVNKEMAEMVDDYFQMFGYACGKIKKPNIHARQLWTYTKTNGCNLTTVKMPVEDKNQIQAIFDNGIRFFTNVSAIGLYNLDNPTL